jgi:hypothetical protein
MNVLEVIEAFFKEKGLSAEEIKEAIRMMGVRQGAGVLFGSLFTKGWRARYEAYFLKECTEVGPTSDRIWTQEAIAYLYKVKGSSSCVIFECTTVNGEAVWKVCVRGKTTFIPQATS